MIYPCFYQLIDDLSMLFTCLVSILPLWWKPGVAPIYVTDFIIEKSARNRHSGGMRSMHLGPEEVDELTKIVQLRFHIEFN